MRSVGVTSVTRKVSWMLVGSFLFREWGNRSGRCLSSGGGGTTREHFFSRDVPITALFYSMTVFYDWCLRLSGSELCTGRDSLDPADDAQCHGTHDTPGWVLCGTSPRSSAPGDRRCCTCEPDSRWTRGPWGCSRCSTDTQPHGTGTAGSWGTRAAARVCGARWGSDPSGRKPPKGSVLDTPGKTRF